MAFLIRPLTRLQQFLRSVALRVKCYVHISPQASYRSATYYEYDAQNSCGRGAGSSLWKSSRERTGVDSSDDSLRDPGQALCTDWETDRIVTVNVHYQRLLTMLEDANESEDFIVPILAQPILARIKEDLTNPELPFIQGQKYGVFDDAIVNDFNIFHAQPLQILFHNATESLGLMGNTSMFTHRHPSLCNYEFFGISFDLCPSNAQATLLSAVDEKALQALFDSEAEYSFLHDPYPDSQPSLGLWRWIILRKMFNWGQDTLNLASFAASLLTCPEATADEETSAESLIVGGECSARGIGATENVNGLLNAINAYSQINGGSSFSFGLSHFQALCDYIQNLYEHVFVTLWRHGKIPPDSTLVFFNGHGQGLSILDDSQAKEIWGVMGSKLSMTQNNASLLFASLDYSGISTVRRGAQAYVDTCFAEEEDKAGRVAHIVDSFNKNKNENTTAISTSAVEHIITWLQSVFDNPLVEYHIARAYGAGATTYADIGFAQWGGHAALQYLSTQRPGWLNISNATSEQPVNCPVGLSVFDADETVVARRAFEINTASVVALSEENGTGGAENGNEGSNDNDNNGNEGENGENNDDDDEEMTALQGLNPFPAARGASLRATLENQLSARALLPVSQRVPVLVPSPSGQTYRTTHSLRFPDVPEFSCWTRRVGIEGRRSDEENGRSELSLHAARTFLSLLSQSEMHERREDRLEVLRVIDLSGFSGGDGQIETVLWDNYLAPLANFRVNTGALLGLGFYKIWRLVQQAQFSSLCADTMDYGRPLFATYGSISCTEANDMIDYLFSNIGAKYFWKSKLLSLTSGMFVERTAREILVDGYADPLVPLLQQYGVFGGELEQHEEDEDDNDDDVGDSERDEGRDQRRNHYGGQLIAFTRNASTKTLAYRGSYLEDEPPTAHPVILLAKAQLGLTPDKGEGSPSSEVVPVLPFYGPHNASSYFFNAEEFACGNASHILSNQKGFGKVGCHLLFSFDFSFHPFFLALLR